MNRLIQDAINFLEKKKVQYLSGAKSARLEDHIVNRIETLFVADPFFLLKFTHLIEQTIIQEELRDGKMFANFLCLSQIESRKEKYRQIATLGNQIWVYGAKEIENWKIENLTPILLSEDDVLARVHFIIYRNDLVSYGLVARRSDADGSKGENAASGQPKFSGFWTTRPSINHYLAEHLEKFVNPERLISMQPATDNTHGGDESRT